MQFNKVETRPGVGFQSSGCAWLAWLSLASNTLPPASAQALCPQLSDIPCPDSQIPRLVIGQRPTCEPQPQAWIQHEALVMSIRFFSSVLYTIYILLSFF